MQCTRAIPFLFPAQTGQLLLIKIIITIITNSMANPRHCVMRETTISVSLNYYFTIFSKCYWTNNLKNILRMCVLEIHTFWGESIRSKTCR